MRIRREHDDSSDSGGGYPRFPALKNQNETPQTQAILPNLGIFLTALAWDLHVSTILGALRLLSSPNPGDELVESLNLGAAELFPELIFGSFPRLSVESSVNKAN